MRAGPSARLEGKGTPGTPGPGPLQPPPASPRAVSRFRPPPGSPPAPPLPPLPLIPHAPQPPAAVWPPGASGSPAGRGHLPRPPGPRCRRSRRSPALAPAPRRTQHGGCSARPSRAAPGPYRLLSASSAHTAGLSEPPPPLARRHVPVPSRPVPPPPAAPLRRPGRCSLCHTKWRPRPCAAPCSPRPSRASQWQRATSALSQCGPRPARCWGDGGRGEPGGAGRGPL